MTVAQRSHLDNLAPDAEETISADLTKAQTCEHIEHLQESTGQRTTGRGEQQTRFVA